MIIIINDDDNNKINTNRQLHFGWHRQWKTIMQNKKIIICTSLLYSLLSISFQNNGYNILQYISVVIFVSCNQRLCLSATREVPCVIKLYQLCWHQYHNCHFAMCHNLLSITQLFGRLFFRSNSKNILFCNWILLFTFV